jgi:hypothetical protein
MALTSCCTPTPHANLTRYVCPNQTSTPRQEHGMTGLLSPASLQAHPCRNGSTSDLPSALLASLIGQPPVATHSFCLHLSCASVLFRFCNRAHSHPYSVRLLDTIVCRWRPYKSAWPYFSLGGWGGWRGATVCLPGLCVRARVCVCVCSWFLSYLPECTCFGYQVLYRSGPAPLHASRLE